MTALARLILRQRSAVILVALILLVAGGITATRMQEELLPNVSFDTVSIVTADPGADSNSVLKDVTKPIEVAVASMPGINTLASFAYHPAFLARHDVAAAQPAASLQANNFGIPASNLMHNGVIEPVFTTAKLTTLAQIRNLPVTVHVSGVGRQATGDSGASVL